MNFAHPKVLWFGLALLPLLAVFLWFTWKKRQEVIRQFVQNKLLAELALGVSVPRQIWRRVLLFTGVAFLLLGMAGPRWGFSWEEAAQRGRDVLIAIDTSRSMLANDVQPDRLTRAKLAALDLLQLGKFDRFGLIAFAGSAFLQCPLTFDDEAFRQSVQILQPGIIPQGGTALAEAIKTAREAFGTDEEENHKILILFTDGEDHQEEVNDAVERAVTTGIKIFTVGVGTPSGELLRIRDEQGRETYLKDEAGNVVKSRLNDQLLREIATSGKGFYLPLQGGNAMEVLYQKGLAPLPTSERNTKLMKQLKEQFYWPLALGILLLIVEVLIPEQKRAPRKKEASSGPVPAAVAILLLLATLSQTVASPAKAHRHYQAGEYKSALAEYQELLTKEPNDARLRYNAGAAAYQATKFDEAVKQFQAAAASPDLDLQQQSFYNLGNAEFRLGQGDSDVKQRAAIWEQAVQHFEAALKLNPQDKDAEFNRDLVKKKLEELKQQQQDQSKQDNKNNENKDQSKDQQDKDQKGDKKDNKSDQQQQDQKKENNPSDKNQQEKQDQAQKQDQQKDQSQQQKSEADQQKEHGQDKKDQANAQQGGEQNKQGEKPEGEDSAAQYAQLGKMSPAQAKQLLDAQRSEEKALLFIPQERKGAPQNRVFKDW